jgi:hypothetical protein
MVCYSHTPQKQAELAFPLRPHTAGNTSKRHIHMDTGCLLRETSLSRNMYFLTVVDHPFPINVPNVSVQSNAGIPRWLKQVIGMSTTVMERYVWATRLPRWEAPG